MSQIEITILKQGIPSRNVITCCLFTAGDSYRKINEYIGNFKRFLKQTVDMKAFEVRVYTDDTAKNVVLQETSDDPRVTVLHYNCPQFRDGAGHLGMFGALVRFLPMFEDLDTVWCSDIDIPDRYLDLSLLEKRYDFLISTYSCYERKVWGTKNTILAGRFISRIQFPRALLTLFLNRVSSGKLDEKIEEINSGNVRKPRSDFPYGLDEYFLNTYIYNTLKARDSKILVQKDYLDSEVIFKSNIKEDKELLLKYFYFPTHARFLKLKKLFLEYVPLYLNTHPCYKETLDVLVKAKSDFIVLTSIRGSDL